MLFCLILVLLLFGPAIIAHWDGPDQQQGHDPSTAEESSQWWEGQERPEAGGTGRWGGEIPLGPQQMDGRENQQDRFAFGQPQDHPIMDQIGGPLGEIMMTGGGRPKLDKGKGIAHEVNQTAADDWPPADYQQQMVMDRAQQQERDGLEAIFNLGGPKQQHSQHQIRDNELAIQMAAQQQKEGEQKRQQLFDHYRYLAYQEHVRNTQELAKRLNEKQGQALQNQPGAAERHSNQPEFRNSSNMSHLSPPATFVAESRQIHFGRQIPSLNPSSSNPAGPQQEGQQPTVTGVVKISRGEQVQLANVLHVPAGMKRVYLSTKNAFEFLAFVPASELVGQQSLLNINVPSEAEPWIVPAGRRAVFVQIRDVFVVGTVPDYSSQPSQSPLQYPVLFKHKFGPHVGDYISKQVPEWNLQPMEEIQTLPRGLFGFVPVPRGFTVKLIPGEYQSEPVEFIALIHDGSENDSYLQIDNSKQLLYIPGKHGTQAVEFLALRSSHYPAENSMRIPRLLEVDIRNIVVLIYGKDNGEVTKRFVAVMRKATAQDPGSSSASGSSSQIRQGIFMQQPRMAQIPDAIKAVLVPAKQNSNVLLVSLQPQQPIVPSPAGPPGVQSHAMAGTTQEPRLYSNSLSPLFFTAGFTGQSRFSAHKGQMPQMSNSSTMDYRHQLTQLNIREESAGSTMSKKRKTESNKDSDKSED